MNTRKPTRGERTVDVVIGAVTILSIIGFPMLCAAILVQWWS